MPMNTYSFHSRPIAPRRSLGESWLGSPDGARLRIDAGQCDTSLIYGPGRTAKGVLVSLPLRQIGLLRPRPTAGYRGCILPRTVALRRVDMEGGLVGKNAIFRRDYEPDPVSGAKTMSVGPGNRYCACLGQVRAVCAPGL